MTQESRDCPYTNQQADLRAFYSTSEGYLFHLKSKDPLHFYTFVEQVVRYIDEGATLLDVGCGTGLSSSLLAQRGYGVIGLDISALFLREASASSSGAVYLVADACHLPLPDEVLGAVTAFEFIEHVPDVERCLSEMLRVAKPRAHIVIMSPNLLTPIVPLKDLWHIVLGRPERAEWCGSLFEACRLILHNTKRSIGKLIERDMYFLPKEPCLDRPGIPDSDAVYYASQLDLVRFFRSQGCDIRQITIGVTLIGRLIAQLLPYISRTICVVARK